MVNGGTSTEARPHATGSWRKMHAPLMALALVGALAACAKGDIIGGNSRQMAVTEPTDGFLPQPDLLARNEGTLWDLTWMKPGMDFSSIRDVMLAPVTVVTSPTSKLAALPPDQRDKLANTFYDDLFKAVSKNCKMATRPGAGTVVFHVALSDATSSNGVLKTVATYAPYVNVAYKVGSFAFNDGVGYFSGTATAEGYATNGTTGELVWQGVDKRGGNAPLLQNTTDKWLDVHHTFEAWSAQFVQKLKETGICPQAVAAK